MEGAASGREARGREALTERGSVARSILNRGKEGGKKEKVRHENKRRLRQKRLAKISKLGSAVRVFPLKMLNPARRLVPLARASRQTISSFSSLSSPLRYENAKYSQARDGRDGSAPRREGYGGRERDDRGDRGTSRDAGRGMANFYRKESSAPRRDTQHRQNGQPFTDSYHLSDRVKLLATRKEFDSAIDLVKTSSASNVVVWNLLIHEVLMQRDFKRAYELWMDMKRRGMTPTTRSYSTFFAGYGKIKELEGGALGRVQTIYAQWLMYSERVLASAGGRRSILEDAEDPESISCIPTNAYLTLLGNVKNYALLMETFTAMPSSGPTAPNSLTYSIVLGALRASDEPEHFQSAMKLWQRMLSEGIDIDTKTISLIISICREAKRPDDQKVGLEIAKEFYGFVNPEDEASLVFAMVKPKAPLDTTALSNVISLALAMQQYNLVVRWFDQVRDHPKRFGKTVLENWHCDLVMVALAVKKDATGAEGQSPFSLRRSQFSLILRRPPSLDASILLFLPPADDRDVHERDPGVLASRRSPSSVQNAFPHDRSTNSPFRYRRICPFCFDHFPPGRAHHFDSAADQFGDEESRRYRSNARHRRITRLWSLLLPRHCRSFPINSHS